MPSLSFFSGGQRAKMPARGNPPINANLQAKFFILVPPARRFRARCFLQPAPGAPDSSLIPRIPQRVLRRLPRSLRPAPRLPVSDADEQRLGRSLALPGRPSAIGGPQVSAG